jgi:hypothetical protein
MSKGLGHIERTIAAEIEKVKSGRYSHGDPCPVHESSRSIAFACFRSNGRKVQRAAAAHAMRSFVRKHPQFAVTGGKGRNGLTRMMTPRFLSGSNWRRMPPEGKNGPSQGTRLSTKVLLKIALL